MGRVSRVRRAGSIAIGFLLVAISAAPVVAESALWTLSASPLATTTGIPTMFTLQATNQDPLAVLTSSARIGCVQVDVPANFSVASAQVSGSSGGGSWTASLAGNRVRVQAGSGGDRLRTLDWVRFTVRATAASAGSIAWASRAFERMDCGGSGALLGLPPIVVVTGPAPTPTPVPTPLPTLPTVAPTPTLPPLPSILPSLPPIGETPAPTRTPTAIASPSDRPAESEDPRATPTPTAATSRAPGSSDGPDASADPSAGAPAASDGGPDGGVAGGPPVLPVPRESGPTVLVEPADLDLGGTGIGLSGIGIWIVPGAAIAGPGLLILLWIALQAVGAFAWLPAVRRLRGDGERMPA